MTSAMQKLLMVVVLVTLVLGLSAVGAAAQAGGCSPGFTLVTVDQAIRSAPSPALANTIRSHDGNGDGYLCIKTSPTFVDADNTAPK